MVETTENTRLRLIAIVFGLCGVVLFGVEQWGPDVKSTMIAAGFGVGAIVLFVGVILRSERWFAVASALTPALVGALVVVFSESLQTMALLIIAGAVVEVLLVPVYVRIGESGASIGEMLKADGDPPK
jgi:hypothetical protein